MTSVKCSFKDCGYLNQRGFCRRERIILQQADKTTNELYCLGWATPETKLFNDIINATSPALEAKKE